MKVRVFQLDGTVTDVLDIRQLVVFEPASPIPVLPVSMGELRTLVLIRENILGFVTTPEENDARST